MVVNLVEIDKELTEIFDKNRYNGRRFFNSGYAHDRNISIFRRRAFKLTGNTLIKPNYASVKQSRDSLHRDNKQQILFARKKHKHNIRKIKII